VSGFDSAMVSVSIESAVSGCFIDVGKEARREVVLILIMHSL
jgi:hypothetical protein